MIKLICDLEATCTDNNEFPREEMEIIEIGAVILDESGVELGRYQSFVKPNIHKTLTSFCKDLTGIDQSDVDTADSYPLAMSKFCIWIDEVTQGRKYTFCSWGDFDRNIITRQSRNNKHYQSLSIVSRTINLKKEFGRQNNLKRDPGVWKALQIKGLTFEGSHHRALDDAVNIARLANTLDLTSY